MNKKYRIPTENMAASAIRSDLTDAQKQAIRDNIGVSGSLLLETAIADGDSFVDFTLDQGFDKYVIDYFDAFTGSTLPLYVLFSDDGGTTFDNGASDYSWTGLAQNSGGQFPSYDDSDEDLRVGNLGVSQSGKGSGTIIITNLDSSSYTVARGEGNGFSSASILEKSSYVGARLSAQADNAVRISTGVSLSGTFKLYGVR